MCETFDIIEKKPVFNRFLQGKMLFLNFVKGDLCEQKESPIVATKILAGGVKIFSYPPHRFGAIPLEIISG